MPDPSRFRGAASRQLLADHVYDELMVELIEGHLEAGEPINIDSLSRDLEVSQTPIREALARMEATGLVVRTALKGYRVAPLFSPRELTELMDARLVLEPEIAFLACEHATPEVISEMDDTIRQLSESKSGVGPYWQADERFHRLIAETANNRFLLSAYAALGGQVQRFRLFGGLEVTDSHYAIAEHEAVVEAFREADPSVARERMADHLRKVRERAVSESAEA